jgi:hypothetical protein
MPADGLAGSAAGRVTLSGVESAQPVTGDDDDADEFGDVTAEDFYADAFEVLE